MIQAPPLCTDTRYKAPLHFVLFIGVVSFPADYTYEESRSITGPLLAVLGATATVLGKVSGFGELLSYGLGLVVAFCLLSQLAAIPFFSRVSRLLDPELREGRADPCAT